MTKTVPSAAAEAPPAALRLARDVLEIEASAITALIERLDETFLRAVKLILDCDSRVVVSGIGKSGHVGRKIASTLASTGTPAFFVHPAEASHGDLGMITRRDVMIAISYSGESDELLTIIPLVKRQGAKLIAMTGNPQSTLATEADAHLNVHVAKEACPLNLAPTASTTATLALGDALAVALLDARGFKADDFARSHPGGSLGRRLLTYVNDVMKRGKDVPAVRQGAPLTDAILEISRKGMGMTAIVDEHDHVLGIFTDGDLRRAVERGVDLRGANITEIMTPSPLTIAATELAVEAVELMESRRINQLLVTDAEQKLIGALNMHDLFQAKVV